MTQDRFIGQQFDEYRIDSLLGAGNMARIYLATDIRLHRKAAIKVIGKGFQRDSEYIMRFEREAQAIAQLSHPHIVQLYRYGEAAGVLYMAMQYIEGASLAVVLESYKHDRQYIEANEALRIVREMCDALDYAHNEGVIHRDIKPQNIMLDTRGKAILTDFGLVLIKSRGTRGGVLGTPHYLAPEQARSSANARPQSDLYSLGVVIYEMFTNTRPFEAENQIEIAMKHLTAPPRPPREIRPELSPEIESVILKCLRKNPEERYQSGKALSSALDAAYQTGGIGQPTGSAPAPAPPGSILSRTLAVPMSAVTDDPGETKPVADIPSDPLSGPDADLLESWDD